MRNNNQNLDISQAVFTVCVSKEDCATAIAVTNEISGSQFVGEFSEYLTADRRPQFSNALKSAGGIVALIDCDSEPSLALATMERLRQTFSQKVSLVALSAQTDAEFLLRAMRSGCADFLEKPVSPAQLTTALLRFQSTQIAAIPSPSLGRIVALFGVKGGVGTTTIAVHLAMHLVSRHSKKVLLIDHKHELGHVALQLGMKASTYSFSELIRNVERLDAELIEGFVTRHPSGLDVLPSPDQCAPPDLAGVDVIERVMEQLQRRYDFILFDSSIQNSNSLTAMVASCDEVAMVSTPDVAALRDLTRWLDHLGIEQGSAGKVHVVINRSTSDDAVSVQRIEDSLGFPIAHSIPNHYSALMRAGNAGEPISPRQRDRFTLAVAKWASVLSEGSELTAESPPFNLFRFLRSRKSNSAGRLVTE